MDYKELVGRLRAGKWTNAGFTDDQSLEWDAADAITGLLTRAETAEQKLAECEPVHAHWELDECREFRCSHCKGYASMDIFRIHSVQDKFCRNCGAIMDEAVE